MTLKLLTIRVFSEPGISELLHSKICDAWFTPAHEDALYELEGQISDAFIDEEAELVVIPMYRMLRL